MVARYDPPPWRATRILLAEDEGSWRGRSSWPSGTGATTSAGSGRCASCGQQPAFGPKLLILDVSLDTDGLEYLQAIRFTADCPPAGVVVLADPGDTASRDRAHQLGAAAVVSKPVEETRLVALVEELVSFV